MNPFQKIDDELQYLAIEFCQCPIDDKLQEIISSRVKIIIESIKKECRLSGVSDTVANRLDDFKLTLYDGEFTVNFKNINYLDWFTLVNTRV